VDELLQIHDLAVEYDGVRALQGVTLQAQRGHIVALVGANGAGKSSLLRAISGIVPAKTGRIEFDGQAITREPPHRIVARGIAHVPEGRRVFATATVRDNLLLGAYVLHDRGERERRLNEVFTTFPRLRERLTQRASTLSGGEQQMLAIARALIANPEIILLDEQMEGLAPLIARGVEEVVLAIKAEGHTILLVEQNVQVAMSLSDRGYILSNGRVMAHGKIADLKNDTEAMQRYLAV